MMQIQGSAAYVRNPEAEELPPDSEALRSLEQDGVPTPADAHLRIWELLETPQTVETLCRVLRHEFDLPPASCTEGVKIVLTKLYREDLIQLSPDT